MGYNVRVGARALPLWESGHTSNILPMWRAATGSQSLSDLDGMPGAAAAAAIEVALRAIRADHARYLAMEPASKWGTVASFTSFLEAFRSACLAHPRARVLVSA